MVLIYCCNCCSAVFCCCCVCGVIAWTGIWVEDRRFSSVLLYGWGQTDRTQYDQWVWSWFYGWRLFEGKWTNTRGGLQGLRLCKRKQYCFNWMANYKRGKILFLSGKRNGGSQRRKWETYRDWWGFLSVWWLWRIAD